jgi:hypothetical protein
MGGYALKRMIVMQVTPGKLLQDERPTFLAWPMITPFELVNI